MNENHAVRHWVSKPLTVFCTAAILTACSSLPGKTPEEVVRERAQARWDALIAGKWEQAYSYATPSYREGNELYNFRRRLDRGLVKYKKAVVEKVSCEQAGVCIVKVQVSILPSQDIKTGVITSGIEERWLRVDGNWWRFEKQ